MVENDEKVETLDYSGVLEMVVLNDEPIHETVEKVGTVETDELVEIDIQFEAELLIKQELVENEFYKVEQVEVQADLIIDEMVETQ